MNINQNSQQLKPRVFPRPEVNGKGNGYIIMPPEDTTLFKSGGLETPTLDSFGVTKRENLDILGGYLAELSPQQVKDMEKKGFRVFKDSVQQYLPNHSKADLNEVAQSALALAKKGDTKAEAAPSENPLKGKSNFVPRKEMEGPRFDSNIERAARGGGVTIAVLDSGVNPHPDFGERLLGQIDFVNGEAIPYDDNGHGTHVAGDAAGNGSIDPRFAGPASEANIISMKVLSGSGSGSTSGIVKAIQTAVQLKEDLNIKVINMSLGGPASKNGESDPINMAIKAAKEAGITVVVAAGNEGPEQRTVGSPGNSLNAITVGAIDDRNTADPSDDVPTSFSSRGPTPDGVSKPDIMAPGMTIMAPLSPQSAIADDARSSQVAHRAIQYLDNLPFELLQNAPDEMFAVVGIDGGTAAAIKADEETSDLVFTELLKATSGTPLDETGAYVGLPGTSMATPIVAGVAAQLLGVNPDLTPDMVQDILLSTADKLPDGRLGPNTQGAGALNPKAAILKAMQTEVEKPEAPEFISSEEALAAELEKLGISLEDVIAGIGDAVPVEDGEAQDEKKAS